MHFFRIVISLLSIHLIVAPAIAQSQRALSVEQITVQEAKPSEGAYSITATLNNFDGVYRIGDPVDVSVSLDKSAYVLVLNVDESGRIVQLFPNKFESRNFFQAGQTYKLPGEGARIVAAGPPGLELIKIIVSEKSLSLDAMMETAPIGPFEITPPGAGEGVARALGVSPLQMPASPDPEPEAPSPVEVLPEFGAWAELTLVLSTVSADDSPSGAAPTLPGEGEQGEDSGMAPVARMLCSGVRNLTNQPFAVKEQIECV
ncbi:MAG: DUF4384 domain-containing protein [Pseudomonadota bacterium]